MLVLCMATLTSSKKKQTSYTTSLEDLLFAIFSLPNEMKRHTIFMANGLAYKPS